MSSFFVKISNGSIVFRIYLIVLTELPWITEKCKEAFSVSPPISFMEFLVFQEHARIEIETDIIGFVIPGTTKNKQRMWIRKQRTRKQTLRFELHSMWYMFTHI